MKVLCWIQTSVVGSRCEDIIDLEDDTVEEDIEDEAREAAFNMADWGFEIVEGGE